MREVHYSLDDGEEVVIDSNTASVSIDEEGIHTLMYFAVDVAGNVEDTQVLEDIKLDKTAPDSTNDYDGLWHTEDFSVNINAEDT